MLYSVVPSACCAVLVPVWLCGYHLGVCHGYLQEVMLMSDAVRNACVNTGFWEGQMHLPLSVVLYCLSVVTPVCCCVVDPPV